MMRVLTALALIAVLGPVARFPDSKHVVSYTGLAPAVHASADTCRLGQITKQGSPLLRFVLGQAGLIYLAIGSCAVNNVLGRSGRTGALPRRDAAKRRKDASKPRSFAGGIAAG